MYMTITERLTELREYAREDGETCNESSIADFLAFPPQIAGMEGPYLFMDESGNMRALWRNAQRRFGIDFYGQGKARLISRFLDEERRPEMSYFTLVGMPAELNEESFLGFVKEHVYEPLEEIPVEPDQQAVRTS
jgi:hypothetical protein